MGGTEGECSGKTLVSVILLSIGSTLESSRREGEDEARSHVTHMRAVTYAVTRYVLHMISILIIKRLRNVFHVPWDESSVHH